MISAVSQQSGPILAPVQHGKWDAAFLSAGNPDAGFNFSGSPFGEDQFDLFYFNPASTKYREVFTGFIFYKLLEVHLKKYGFPKEFDNFEDTLLRRASCVDAPAVEQAKKDISWHHWYPQTPVNSEIFPYSEK
ncbi:MAG: hypothetical protein NT040_08695 [Bacteroidetes bacterium]|nr:hypothetical protein [Bacteroidota bacterium]